MKKNYQFIFGYLRIKKLKWYKMVKMVILIGIVIGILLVRFKNHKKGNYKNVNIYPIKEDINIISKEIDWSKTELSKEQRIGGSILSDSSSKGKMVNMTSGKKLVKVPSRYDRVSLENMIDAKISKLNREINICYQEKSKDWNDNKILKIEFLIKELKNLRGSLGGLDIDIENFYKIFNILNKELK
jgi:hypothetical protein